VEVRKGGCKMRGFAELRGILLSAEKEDKLVRRFPGFARLPFL
jgi:hypothetical protein